MWLQSGPWRRQQNFSELERTPLKIRFTGGVMQFIKKRESIRMHCNKKNSRAAPMILPLRDYERIYRVMFGVLAG